MTLSMTSARNCWHDPLLLLRHPGRRVRPPVAKGLLNDPHDPAPAIAAAAMDRTGPRGHCATSTPPAREAAQAGGPAKTNR
jgi:hypothetical protein